MPSDPTVFQEQKARLYSHAPPSASLDISNFGGAYPLHPNGKTIPYDMTPDTGDPLSGFLVQSEQGLNETEAERIGADRFGMTWPMIRAQRLHCGDSHFSEAMARRLYAHSRLGVIFTPVEVPMNPDFLYAAAPKPVRKAGATYGRQGY